jgi:hypothetical protein
MLAMIDKDEVLEAHPASWAPFVRRRRIAIDRLLAQRDLTDHRRHCPFIGVKQPCSPTPSEDRD